MSFPLPFLLSSLYVLFLISISFIFLLQSIHSFFISFSHISVCIWTEEIYVLLYLNCNQLRKYLGNILTLSQFVHFFPHILLSWIYNKWNFFHHFHYIKKKLLLYKFLKNINNEHENNQLMLVNFCTKINIKLNMTVNTIFPQKQYLFSTIKTQQIRDIIIYYL